MRSTAAVLALVLSGCGGKATIDREPGQGVGGHDDSDATSSGAASGTGGSTASGPAPTACELPDQPSAFADFYDVFAVMVNDDAGNCTSAPCHGDEGTAASGVFLPVFDIWHCHETLLSITDAEGRRYVDVDDPRDSWIHCHLRTHPPGGLAPADLGVVEDWLLSGVPAP